MEMDSKVNYGQELGLNMMKICKKLLDNQNLCKLLVNTDLDPVNPNLHKDDIDAMELFGKNIRVVPLVTSEDETTASKVVLVFSGSEVTDENSMAEGITLLCYVYTPYKEWLIAGDQLRPFAIMAEIRKSIQNKRINGLGEIRYEGFDISSLTNQTGSYLMRFRIVDFS